MKNALWLVVAVLALSSAWVFAADPPPSKAANTVPHSVEFKEIKWDALVPKNWDPLQRFRGRDLAALSDDDDPILIQQIQREIREIWDKAPVNADMNGLGIKLSGYVVPLEMSKGEMKEFLLVPYFGACIHTPPPPANQIVHVISSTPVKNIKSMDTVWVSGVLKTFRGDSIMGVSGYQMRLVTISPYASGKR